MLKVNLFRCRKPNILKVYRYKKRVRGNCASDPLTDYSVRYFML
jgi:hypothetical protein